MKKAVFTIFLTFVCIPAFTQTDEHNLSLGDREQFIIYHPPISLFAPQYYTLGNTAYFNGFFGGYPKLIKAIEELFPPQNVLTEIKTYNTGVWIVRGISIAGASISALSMFFLLINHAVNINDSPVGYTPYGNDFFKFYLGYFITSFSGIGISIVSSALAPALRPTNVIKEFNRWRK